MAHLVLAQVGYPTGTRTPINGSRNRCPTVRRSGMRIIYSRLAKLFQSQSQVEFPP